VRLVPTAMPLYLRQEGEGQSYKCRFLKNVWRDSALR